MAHPYFGREGRMGMGTVFKKDGREGRPSKKKWTVPKSVLEQELRESRVTSRLSPRARAFHTIPAPEIYLHH